MDAVANRTIEMSHQLIHTTWDKLMSNDFISAGLVLGLLGSILALMKTGSTRFWKFLQNRFTMSLYVTTHDEPYDWLTAFFAEFPNAHGNHLTVSPTATDCEYDDYGNPIEDSNADAKVSLIPISGSHRIWYRGQPIWFSFNRDTGKCPTEYLVCDFKIAQY